MVTSIVNLSLPVDDPNRYIEIPGYVADSYSETLSTAQFESVTTMGRSSPVAMYLNGNARSISFSMQFHRDMIAPYSTAVNYSQPGIDGDTIYQGLYLGEGKEPLTEQQLLKRYYNNLLLDIKNQIDYDSFSNLSDYLSSVSDYGGEIERILFSLNTGIPPEVYLNKQLKQGYDEHTLQAEIEASARFQTFINKIKALNYPVYSPAGVVAPQVYLKIGETLRLKGYCETSITWQNISKFNNLISANVTFNFTEVVDQAWSATEVITGMQRYIKWMDRGLNLR